MFRMMRLFCCCERCWTSSAAPKEEPVDDDNTHVAGSRTGGMSHADQPFYVPRRHSSYNTGSFNPVYVQPRVYNSDSCSSSADEEAHPTERARCWSTVAATTPSEVAAFVAQQQPSELSPTRSYEGSKGTSMSFERHALAEIAEMEPLTYQSPENSPKLDDEPQGNLSFTTTYDEEEQKLTISLERATDLPVKGSLTNYDTFVKFVISSSRKTFRVSRPVRKSLNPIYDEEFVFPLSRAKWKATRNHFLRLSLFDNDRQGRHDAIGHVILQISKIIAEKVQKHNLGLMPRTMPITNIGQLLLGLSYFPTQSRLFIHVIKGRHLRLDPDVSKYSFRPINKETYDTFVKATLMCGGQKVKTSKSAVVSDTNDPLYSHKSNFVVPPQFLLYSSIVVSIAVKGVLGRNVTLGRITVGPYTEYADGSYTHWGKMLQDGRSVVKWRNLYL